MPKRREYLLQHGQNLLGGLKSVTQKVLPKKKKKNKSLKEQNKENGPVGEPSSREPPMARNLNIETSDDVFTSTNGACPKSRCPSSQSLFHTCSHVLVYRLEISGPLEPAHTMPAGSTSHLHTFPVKDDISDADSLADSDDKISVLAFHSQADSTWSGQCTDTSLGDGFKRQALSVSEASMALKELLELI
ncbi:hypothetical protein BDN71DRAFT_1501066 [Pleurotus eryngii]|uniref:Uncharacterized protein n=1 Tax=Pleurotus eryngii TaxID=5323 RepID=A0A9P6A8S3_PLEER|nr:hypothetical protein BDN71DRAFT_1501066 [Pleurotus eryngii]